MKNRIIIGVTITLLLVGFIALVVNKKKELSPNDLGNEINTIEVSKMMPNEVIEYENITIKNITLDEEEKALYFKIASNQDVLNQNLSVVLLNPQVKESANTKTLTIKNLKEERIVKLDLNNLYNNPEKIKFIIGGINEKSKKD